MLPEIQRDQEKSSVDLEGSEKSERQARKENCREMIPVLDYPDLPLQGL